VSGLKAAADTVQRVTQSLAALRGAGADTAAAAEALQASIASSEAAEAESISAADALMAQVCGLPWLHRLVSTFLVRVLLRMVVQCTAQRVRVIPDEKLREPG